MSKAQKPARRPGDLQLAILRVLWDRQEASVAEVHQSLHRRRLAPTTIATMLRKMEDRGLVTHRKEGRSFVYRARLTEAEVSRQAVAETLDAVFEGSVSAMVSHLLEQASFRPDELAQLRELIGEKEKQIRRTRRRRDGDD